MAVPCSADDMVKRAEAATSAKDVLTILGAGSAELGRRVMLEFPAVVVQGAKATVTVTSRIPGTDMMVLIVDRLPHPLVGVKEFAPGVDESLQVEVVVQQTSTLRAVVRAAGKYYQVSRELKVATPEGVRRGR